MRKKDFQLVQKIYLTNLTQFLHFLHSVTWWCQKMYCVYCIFFFYFLSPFLFPFGLLCIFLSIICNAVCNLLAIKYIQVTYNRLSEIRYRMHYQLCCSKTLPFFLKKDNKFANMYVQTRWWAWGHWDWHGPHKVLATTFNPIYTYRGQIMPNLSDFPTEFWKPQARLML